MELAKKLPKNPVVQDVVSFLLKDTSRLDYNQFYFDVDASTALDMDETVSYLNHHEKVGLKSFFSARYYEENKVEICCGYANPLLNPSERLGIRPSGRITRFKVAFIWFNKINYGLTKEQLETEWNERYANTSLGTWHLEDE